MAGVMQEIQIVGIGAIMICYFNINDESKENEMINFFSSIGADAWFQPHNIHRKINIEFIDTPELVAFLSNLGQLGICSINQLGVTFYVTPHDFQGIDERNSTLEWEIKDSPDGVIFCPMSNIKSINTVGKIVSNSNS